MPQEVKEDTVRGYLRAFICSCPAASLFRRLLEHLAVAWYDGMMDPDSSSFACEHV